MLDEKDCKILNLLQEDCRMSITNIAKEIGLSVDSTKKRLDKLLKQRIFYPRVQIRPRAVGFPDIIDVKIKIGDYNEVQIKEFIDYCINHPQIPEVFSISGRWDFTIVIMAENHERLAEISNEIRTKFGSMIQEWFESLTTIAYKFENYDMLKLMGHK